MGISISAGITILLGVFAYFWAWSDKKAFFVSFALGVMIAGTAIGVGVKTGAIGVGKAVAPAVTSQLDSGPAKAPTKGK